MLDFEDIEAMVCDLYLKENKSTVDEADAVLKLLERVKRLDKLRETYMMEDNMKIELVGHETMEHLASLPEKNQLEIADMAKAVESYAFARGLILDDQAVDGGVVDGTHSVVIHYHEMLFSLLYKDDELLAGVVTASEITTILSEWEEYLQTRSDKKF